MVSVIIPVYNVEKYLRECLDSVLAQTYKDLEVILVDDGSSDNSGAICDEYAERDSRFRVIHKKNGGQATARNIGVSVSHGKYIYYLDSDDYLSSDAIEKLVRCADETDADIIAFDAVSFSEDDVDWCDNLIHTSRYPLAPGKIMMCNMLENHEFYAGVPLHFFKSDFLKREKLFFVDRLIYEDLLYLTYAFLKAEKTALLNEKLYYRRLRSGSTTTSAPKKKNVKCYCYVLKRIIRELKRDGAGEVKKHSMRMLIYEHTEYAVEAYFRLDRTQRRSLLKQLRFLTYCYSLTERPRSKKTMIKLTFPGMFGFYRDTFWHVKEWCIKHFKLIKR